MTFDIFLIDSTEFFSCENKYLGAVLQEKNCVNGSDLCRAVMHTMPRRCQSAVYKSVTQLTKGTMGEHGAACL